MSKKGMDNVNDYYVQWGNLLLQKSPDKRQRLEEFQNKYGVVRGLMELREEIINYRGKNYINEDNNLKTLLEDIFLEPIKDNWKIEKSMHENGWTIENIIKKHNKYPTRRLLSIISCKNV